MKLEHRLQSLELKFVIEKPGCNVTLFIVIPEEMLNGPFDSDTYRPTAYDIEKYLKQLKDTGKCKECKGSCSIDWSPQGFKNHTIGGENRSSSQEPKISWMFCADAEIPILTRQLISGKRDSRLKILPLPIWPIKRQEKESPIIVMFIVYQAYKSVAGRLFQVLLPNLPHSFNTIIGRSSDCLIFDRIINLKMKKLNISSHQRRSTRIIPRVFFLLLFILPYARTDTMTTLCVFDERIDEWIFSSGQSAGTFSS